MYVKDTESLSLKICANPDFFLAPSTLVNVLRLRGICRCPMLQLLHCVEPSRFSVSSTHHETLPSAWIHILDWALPYGA